jgi:hypothetical protein
MIKSTVNPSPFLKVATVEFPAFSFQAAMNSPEENTTSQGIRILGEKLNLLKVLEGEEGYEQSMKKPFNEICAKKPLAFIKPKTASEVCDVLRYASADHIHVSVLGGGHDPKGKTCVITSNQ